MEVPGTIFQAIEIGGRSPKPQPWNIGLKNRVATCSQRPPGPAPTGTALRSSCGRSPAAWWPPEGFRPHGWWEHLQNWWIICGIWVWDISSTRYDMIHDMIYDIWYDMTWHDMTWHDTWHDTWYDMIHDIIWYDVIWYDTWVCLKVGYKRITPKGIFW